METLAHSCIENYCVSKFDFKQYCRIALVCKVATHVYAECAKASLVVTDSANVALRTGRYRKATVLVTAGNAPVREHYSIWNQCSTPSNFIATQ